MEEYPDPKPPGAKPVAKVAKGPTKIETESEAKVAEY